MGGNNNSHLAAKDVPWVWIAHVTYPVIWCTHLAEVLIDLWTAKTEIWRVIGMLRPEEQVIRSAEPSTPMTMSNLSQFTPSFSPRLLFRTWNSYLSWEITTQYRATPRSTHFSLYIFEAGATFSIYVFPATLCMRTGDNKFNQFIIANMNIIVNSLGTTTFKFP